MHTELGPFKGSLSRTHDLGMETWVSTNIGEGVTKWIQIFH